MTDEPDDGRNGQPFRSDPPGVYRVSAILAGESPWTEPTPIMSVQDAMAYGTVDDQVAAMNHALRSDPRYMPKN